MSGDIDSLKKLHTVLIDAQKGYEKAFEDAEDAKLATLFREMMVMRDKHHAEIHAELLRLNEKPDEDGSFMATIHRAVISARSMLDGGLDKGSLSAFVDGEKRIAADYDEALAANSENAPVSQMLLQQKAEIQRKIDEMRDLET